MNYEKYMKKCFKLALKAEGKTSPNPMVGCVLLDKDGNEIANGYHKACGEKHAEADALSKVDTADTLVVNLEPCSHYGKTPPCADLIIKKGVKKVVIAMKDPNPIVSGNGIKKCRDANIEVIEGVLEKKAKALNEVFIKNMCEKKCFVAIKTATTIDGKIATNNGNSKWITSEKARKEVQRIRNKYDAILTTDKTVIQDNPSMTCRLNNGKKLTRIIVDRELKTNFSAKIYENTKEKIYIVVDENLNNLSLPKHIELIKCKTYNSKIDISDMLKKIYEVGIRSLLVEAGGEFCGSLVEGGYVDKIYQFIAPRILCDNSGKSAFQGKEKKKMSDSYDYKIEKVTHFSPDILVTYTK